MRSQWAEESKTLCLTMLSSRKTGFTLLEVLVSIAILGLVATGALRLSALATQTLTEVQSYSDLMDKVQILETEILIGSRPDNGKMDGLEWDSRRYSYPLMDGLWRVDFRQLDVTFEGRTITLYIP